MTRRTTAVVAAMLSLFVLSQAGFAAEDLREQLRETEEQLSSRADDLERTQAELKVIGEQLKQSDLQLARLEEELRGLERRLGEAQAAHDAARERTRKATAELHQVAVRLEGTRLELEESEETFDGRVAAAYKYGRVSYAEALMGAEDIADFVNTSYYIRSVMDADRHVIKKVAAATRSLVADRAEADRIREQLVVDEREAQKHQDEAERLAAAHRKVTAMAEDERAYRAELRAKLIVEEAATEAEIAELEAESERLEEELRKSQWRAGAPGQGSWVWPTSGHITSGYGYRTHPIYGSRRMHTGLDISGGWGQPIVAANDGLVIAAYCTAGGYGCRVVMDHGGGYASLYAHQSSFAVREGDVVAAGRVIGYVGSTGASTGPHLHFEIRIKGAHTDPRAYY